MNEPFTFPINPFPDVQPIDFNKLNKKKVTEDFVSENLKTMGWDVFEPFTDTGIDRIISKKICSNGHTPINRSEDSICKVCNTKSIDIVRFVQVKTRALRKGIFGFTLKSKDIRIDPRHLFVLYCDTIPDFLFVSVYEYLTFFDSIGNNPFSSTSFRKGNNKLNSLKFDADEKTWSWNGHSWENFRNANGLKMIQNPFIDLELQKGIRNTRVLSNKLLMKFSAGSSYPVKLEVIINNLLKLKLELYSDKQNIVSEREKVLEHLKKDIQDKSIFESIQKYWEHIKNLEIVGENEQDEE
jgi:hypothetical protein